MGLVGKRTEIGEREEERVSDAFDEVGEDGGGLGPFLTIQRLDGVVSGDGI